MNIAALEICKPHLEDIFTQYNVCIQDKEFLPMVYVGNICLTIHPDDGWPMFENAYDMFVKYLQIELEDGTTIEGQFIEDFQ